MKIPLVGTKSRTAQLVYLPAMGLLIGALFLLIWHHGWLFHSKTRVAVTRAHSSALLILALEHGYFEEQGLDVELVQVPNSVAGLEAMWDGQVDFSTPFVSQVASNIQQGRHPEIVSEVFSSSSLTSLVFRTDRGITRVKDLKGKRIGLMRGSNAEFVLDLLLATEKLSSRDVQIIEVAWDDHINTFKSGSIDAIVTWEPIIEKLVADKTVPASTFNVDYYTEVASVVTTPAYRLEHSEEAAALISALHKADRYYREHTVESQMLLEQKFGAYGLSNVLWDKMDPHVGLTSVLVKMLESELSWLQTREGHRSEPGQLPQDVRAYLVPNYLLQIAPDLVTYK